MSKVTAGSTLPPSKSVFSRYASAKWPAKAPDRQQACDRDVLAVATTLLFAPPSARYVRSQCSAPIRSARRAGTDGVRVAMAKA